MNLYGKRLLLLIASIISLMILCVGQTLAGYFYVGSNGTGSGGSINGTCATQNNTTCTLHAAIEEANKEHGSYIQFNGQFTIEDCSLPALSLGNTTINAYSQWGGGKPGVVLRSPQACGQGNVILTIDSSNNYVHGLHFSSETVGVIGIKIDSGSNNTIGASAAHHRNVFVVAGYGVENVSTGTNNEISSNYFGTVSGYNWSAITGTYGIRSSGPGNTITNNLIIKQSASAIYIIGGDSNIVAHNILGLDVIKETAFANETGIIVEFSSDNDINNNTIGGNTSYGIYLGADSNNNDIHDNDIGSPLTTSHMGNWGDGIYFAISSASGNIVRDNRIVSNLGNGVYGKGALTIQGNTIKDNKESGVWLDESATGVIGGGSDTSKRNTITGNRTGGIRLIGSSSVTISGNIIASNSPLNQYHGIHISGWTAINNKISKNSIYNNGGDGIRLTGIANSSIVPPVIAANGESVYGTTCPGCMVEIFSDNDDEGRFYEGSVVADGIGEFSWTGSFHGRFITATVTNISNTSMFSIPVPAPLFPWMMFLPAVTGH